MGISILYFGIFFTLDTKYFPLNTEKLALGEFFHHFLSPLRRIQEGARLHMKLRRDKGKEISSWCIYTLKTKNLSNRIEKNIFIPVANTGKEAVFPFWLS